MVRSCHPSITLLIGKPPRVPFRVPLWIYPKVFTWSTTECHHQWQIGFTVWRVSTAGVLRPPKISWLHTVFVCQLELLRLCCPLLLVCVDHVKQRVSPVSCPSAWFHAIVSPASQGMSMDEDEQFEAIKQVAGESAVGSLFRMVIHDIGVFRTLLSPSKSISHSIIVVFLHEWYLLTLYILASSNQINTY